MTYKIEITPLTIYYDVDEKIIETEDYAVEIYEIAKGPPGDPGPQGPPGDSTVDVIVYTQASASDTWLINHNLGRFPANITIYSPGGVEVDADVMNLNNNQTQISFAAPYAGSARIL